MAPRVTLSTYQLWRDVQAAIAVADIDQIVEGIEEFIIGDNDDLWPIWQPYIDKLKALRATLEKDATVL